MVQEEETWKEKEECGATEIMYQGNEYFIVPQSAILMLEREEDP